MKYQPPVITTRNLFFITKNGKGDSCCNEHSAYDEELTSRFELYSQIKEGIKYSMCKFAMSRFQEAMADIQSRRRR